jgi:hypothetical protein
LGNEGAGFFDVVDIVGVA